MSNIILINIKGPNLIGLSHNLYSQIAELDVHLIDISHSLLEKQVSLEIIVQLSKDPREKLIGLLQQKCGPLGLDITVREIEQNEAQQTIPITKQSSAAQENYILTLLTHQISAQEIAHIAQITEKHGLDILQITRLSSQSAIDSSSSNVETSCLEFTLHGIAIDLDKIRASLLELAAQFDIDIAIQKSDAIRLDRRLVCFDMDSTLIKAEVIDELAKRAGVGNQVSAITERAMQGELDFSASFKERLALLKGLDETVLREVAEQLPMMEGVETLMRNLKARGFKTAILSGGFSYFGNYLQDKLGFDYVHANTLEVIDGCLSGRVVEPIIDGARKAALLEEIAKHEKLTLQQTVAVGDGANDLPMLNKAGLGIAFRAKPLVRKSAKHSISTHGLDGVLYILGFSGSNII